MRHATKLALLSLFLLAACNPQSSEPWAETELSRAAVAWHPTAPHSRDDENLAKIEKYLGIFSPQPNLFDLHDRRGALAHLSKRSRKATLLLLVKAGLPLESDSAQKSFTYGGESRLLWLDSDTTPVELPATRARQSLPSDVGTISLSSNGTIRIGRSVDTDNAVAFENDIPLFVDTWRLSKNLEPPATASGPDRDAVVVAISHGSLEMDGQNTPPASLSNELAKLLGPEAKPILLEAHADALYGDVVSVLDQLHQAAASGMKISLALEPWKAKERRGGTPAIPLEPGRLDGPTLLFKADAATPYAMVDRVLSKVKGRLDHIVLLTELDTSDHGAINADTWPGGLPGGLLLPLAAKDGVVMAFAPDSHPTFILPEAPEFEPGNPEGPLRVGGDVKPPVKLHAPDPDYTEIAKKARVQGVVIVEAVIDTEGKVRSVRTLKGLPMGLSEKAVEAVKEWRFEPATRNGKKVSVFMNLTVNFRLKSSSMPESGRR